MSFDAHEAFSFDSFEQQLLFWDDFEGDALKDLWTVAGTGSAVVVDAQTGGIVRLTSGATSGDNEILYWGNIRSLHVDQKVTMEVRLKLTQTAVTICVVSLFFDGSNQVSFFYDSSVDGNWHIQTIDGGATTDEDSGIAATTNYVVLRIEALSDGVHFYIDDVEVSNSPLTTNIPDDAADFLQPWLQIFTSEDVAHSMDVDYIYIREER